MLQPLHSVLEDMHVHSTFSDGRDSVRDNLEAAHRRGLRRLTCVDHVRLDSDYVPQLVAEVRQLRSQTPIELYVGVEAKILDGSGLLDVPPLLPGVDFIYAADHQFPLGDRCYKPVEIRHRLRAGELSAEEVTRALVRATIAAMLRHSQVVLAHLFSVLPKVGIAEDSVPINLLRDLAEVAHLRHASVEIDERWRCPGVRTLRAFRAAEVPIFASTDSHAKEDIGVYSYVNETLAQVL